MQPITTPTALIFDLDGTTHRVSEFKDRHEKKYKELADSVEDSIVYEEKGIFDWYTNNSTKISYKMRAIEREKFKEIFDRVYEIQRVYKEKSPISIKIITRGDYNRDEIMRCWDKFYGDDDERFSSGLIPIEFFNSSNFKNKDGQSLHPTAPASDFDKGKLMDNSYSKWSEQMPGLIKKRVFLIDDDAENRKSARRHGFSVIKFPATTLNRKKHITFREYGPIAFKKIHSVIDEAIGIKPPHTDKLVKPNDMVETSRLIQGNLQRPSAIEANCELCHLF